MLKVLVANKHTEENQSLCQILSQDKDIKVISSYTGIDTLNIYHDLEPQVLILDSGFDDISLAEMLKRLSATVLERKKCNILLILEENESLSSDVYKIWTFFRKPFDYDELLEPLKELKATFEIPPLSETELDSILLDLNFHLGADGTKYMKTAITECYYDKSLYRSLDNIYKIVAEQKNKTVKEIRDGMRSSLLPMHKYGNFNTDNSILNLITDAKSVGAKYFLEVFVTYLHSRKNKEKNLENK